MDELSLSRKYIETIPRCIGLMKPYVRKACESDFSFSKYRIIGSIESGKVTVSEIAEAMNVSKPAISKLAEYLVQEKFISRHTCSKDRRVSYLKATAKGKKKFQKIRQQASMMFQENLEQKTMAEREKIRKSLETLEKFVLELQENKSEE